MISRIQARGYRSLRDVDVRVGRFEVLVGPNGSGKSTFLDVIGLLGDMLRVGPAKAIYGDPRTNVAQRTADVAHLLWMRQGSSFDLALEAPLPPDLADMANRPRQPSIFNAVMRFTRCRYEVTLDCAATSEAVEIRHETFSLLPDSLSTAEKRSTLYDWSVDVDHASSGSCLPVVTRHAESGDVSFRPETGDPAFRRPFRPGRSSLTTVEDDDALFPVAAWFARTLTEGVQCVALSSQALRLPSPPGLSPSILPDGANLPWIVHALPEPLRHEWVAHLRTALPGLTDVTTVERPEDRHRYLQLVYDSGLVCPSWLVSDGTLRLLALTILAYIPDLTGIFLVEEPENGIHPRAVETVFEALSQVHGAQVLCATHSPILVGLARADDLLCFGHDPAAGTRVLRGNEHPRLRDWKGEVDLGTYFASGVLE